MTLTSKRICFLVFGFFALAFMASTACYANSSANGLPTQYTITLQKVELCASGSTISNCVNPYVVGTGTQTYDIAAVSPNSSAGEYVTFDPNTWPVGTTFTYLRATLTRTHDIMASIGLTGPVSGFCSTSSGAGSVTALTDGADSASGSASGTIYELNATDGSPAASATIGAESTASKSTHGQTIIDANTNTSIIQLTSPYTATATLPTLTVAFDMQNSIKAYWFTNKDCSGNASGSGHCCFGTGPAGVSITLQ